MRICSKTVLRLSVTVLLMTLLLNAAAGAAFADGFQAVIDVTVGEDAIQVTIPAENEAALNQLVPTLAIPCDYIVARVEKDGESLSGAVTDGTEIRFPVASSGTYMIHRAKLTMDLSDLVIPAEVTEIREEAFSGVEARTVYIQDACVEIGAGAFASSGVKAVRIPANVAVIGENAFNPGVVIYGPAGSYAQYYAEANGLDFAAE